MEFAKKSLGQNFLIDKNIIKKIINLIDMSNKNIIEIGPGKGALTYEIIKKKPKSLLLIEKDNVLANNLKEKFKEKKNITVIKDDILNINFEKLFFKDSIVFGNLPYNISSQILVKFLRIKKWPPKIKGLIFMFQKELGNKILAKFPSKNYGRLSILTNYRLKIKEKFNVSPNCFFPRPEIMSTVIHFVPKKNCIVLKNIENLEKITNIFFSNKRKMINKNLKKIPKYQNILNSLSVRLDLKSRPAEIKPEVYYKFTEMFEKYF